MGGPIRVRLLISEPGYTFSEGLMALLAVLAGDRPLKLRLTELLEPQHSLASVHSWGGLTRIVRERPVTGAIVDLEAVPVHPSSERILAGLRTQFPHLGLVILLQKRRDPFTLFRLGKAGIRNLVLLPVEELKHELAKTLARAGEEGATSFVVRALSPYLPRRELRIAHLAMDSVHRRWSAEELADEVGLTRPTSVSDSRRWDSPPWDTSFCGPGCFMPDIGWRNPAGRGKAWAGSWSTPREPPSGEP